MGSSLESINLYLSGQWPKDGKVKSDAPSVFASYIPHATDGVFKKDTHTQVCMMSPEALNLVIRPVNISDNERTIYPAMYYMSNTPTARALFVHSPHC